MIREDVDQLTSYLSPQFARPTRMRSCVTPRWFASVQGWHRAAGGGSQVPEPPRRDVILHGVRPQSAHHLQCLSRRARGDHSSFMTARLHELANITAWSGYAMALMDVKEMSSASTGQFLDL